MTAVDRLQEGFGTAAGQKAYVDWIANPMTQALVAAARELSRPFRPHVADPNAIAMALGETIGANQVLDFLTNPTSHTALRQRGEKSPQPDYGSRQILEAAEKTRG